MSFKFKSSPTKNRYEDGGSAISCCTLKEFSLFIMVILMTAVLQNLGSGVQAKASLGAKKTLELLLAPSSSIQFRQRREIFANEQQQQPRADNDDDYYDDNYDIIPDVFTHSTPPSLADRLSEQAEKVAQSFQNMWQSLSDSVRHCIDALRAMFGDENLAEEELTPEQEQQILTDMEEKYRLWHEQENEVIMNVYANGKL